MNVTEMSSRNRNLRNRGVNMLLNLLLTVQTSSGPVGDILGECGPDKGSQNQSPGRTYTRMGEVV